LLLYQITTTEFHAKSYYKIYMSNFTDHEYNRLGMSCKLLLKYIAFQITVFTII